MKDSEQRFSSRFTFLLSALGVAVGTGNIWRFPRIAASNGGDDGAGSFLIAWIAFLFLWSIPLIIVEYVMGGKYLEGAARQPELIPLLRTQLFIVMGLVDAVPMIGVGLGLYIMFAA